jgi:hypothetical protein
VDDVAHWIAERPTPLLWVAGPDGPDRTAAIDAVMHADADAAVLQLSTFQPDDAFTRMAGAGERLTTARLFRLAAERNILVLDGCDSIQQPAGQRAGDIVDARFRQLLLAAAGRALARAAIVVTSRMAPPRLLADRSLTVVDRGAVSAVAPDLFPDIDAAIDEYWNALGNFARLHAEGRDHAGAHWCRRLNDGLAPDEISPRLRSSNGAFAVLNDWSQYAVSCGDAVTSAMAAASAYALLPETSPPSDSAVLAAHLAQAHFQAGDLRLAMEWCQRTWDHARAGLQKTEGVAVREAMDAYDWSSNTLAGVYFRVGNAYELRRLIDDLAAIHRRARESVAEFDASSVVSLGGPTGPVTAEQLIEGRLSARLALVEGRFADVGPLAAAVGPRNVAGRELQTLLLRAELSANRDEQADVLLRSLRDDAEDRDDADAECELAVLGLPRIADPGERLASAQVYLLRAEACGLGLRWRDLQAVRAGALTELGRGDAARVAAEAALDRSELPQRKSPPTADARRAPPTSRGGAAAREEMHAAALRVVEAYEQDGTPFALYFRKFDFEVLHGPFELGPKLTENALRDSLPAGIEVITIQEPGSMTYDLESTRFRREAPALALDHERWAGVAGALITRADLIVSEPLMLSAGVRLELQMIYDAQRWDRTVLLLPPLRGYLETIDSDGLVQMFPRCLWADALHTEPLAQSPVIADLLARIRAIAAAPIETRRALKPRSRRDAAYPIDLMPLAEHLEREVRLASVFDRGDETTRYYAFWRLFRASAIRGLRFQEGDTSASNRRSLAHAYLEMSKVMLDHTAEGDKVLLQGDPADARKLVQSAFGLIEPLGDHDLAARALRGEAETRWEELLELQQIVERHPDRFEIRPRYGPLTLAKGQRGKSS